MEPPLIATNAPELSRPVACRPPPLCTTTPDSVTAFDAVADAACNSIPAYVELGCPDGAPPDTVSLERFTVPDRVEGL